MALLKRDTQTHTPGPWTFATRDVSQKPDQPAVIGYVKAAGREIAVLYGGGESDEQRDTNGRLISLAPELYDFVVSVATAEPSQANAQTAQRLAEAFLSKISDAMGGAT